MPHATQDLRALRQRAEWRGGVVSAEDLRECGFSAAVVRRRLASGDWHQWGRAIVLGPAPLMTPRGISARGRSDPREAGVTRRGVNVPAGIGLAHTGLGEPGLAWALQLTYGPSAVISGTPAMSRAGWHLPANSPIVVVHHRPRIVVPGVWITRRQQDRVLVLADGRRYAPALDALLDTLVCLGPAVGADLLDAALQRRYVDPDVLDRGAQARLGRGRTGATYLRTLMERALSGSRSEAEQRMGVLLRRSRSGPWRANHAVRDVSGRVVAEIDFAHEDLRIAIEVDGRAHHSDRRSFERDRARQNLLVVAGWLVLRFTWEQITQRPEEVLAAIDAAVRMRQAA